MSRGQKNPINQESFQEEQIIAQLPDILWQQNTVCIDLHIRLWKRCCSYPTASSSPAPGRSERDLAQLAYDVKGCAVLTASASVLTSLVCHEPASNASTLADAFLHYFEHKPDHWEHGMGDELEALCELRKTPMRIKCVTLPWQALQRLLHQQLPEACA